ncbi:MAG: hypothetical protein AAFR65_03255 [Pseudomonadota bacterium]
MKTKIETTYERISRLNELAASRGGWITARDAMNLAKKELGSEHGGALAICGRAYAGLIQGVARRYHSDVPIRRLEQPDGSIIADYELDHFAVPAKFWWAKGWEALEQNWVSGDFSTWLEKKHQLKAYGVRFFRDDIVELFPKAADETTEQPTIKQTSSEQAKTQNAQPKITKGGRPKKDFWEPMWAMVLTAYAEAKLPLDAHTDLVSFLSQWCINNGHKASDSALKERATMIRDALKEAGHNL